MVRAQGPGRYDRSLSRAQRSTARLEHLLDVATEVFAARGYFLNVAYVAGRLSRRPDEPAVYALAKGLEAAGVRALQRGEPESVRSVAPRMSQLLLDAFGHTG